LYKSIAFAGKGKTMLGWHQREPGKVLPTAQQFFFKPTDQSVGSM